MSLLHPTPGQVLDRLSILRLKQEAYANQGRDAAGLVKEISELIAHINKLGVSLPAVAILREELATINEALWSAEDRVRQLGASEVRELAATAKVIAQLNDDRMRLVKRIDEVLGWKEPVEDKVYGA